MDPQQHAALTPAADGAARHPTTVEPSSPPPPRAATGLTLPTTAARRSARQMAPIGRAGPRRWRPAARSGRLVSWFPRLHGRVSTPRATSSSRISTAPSSGTAGSSGCTSRGRARVPARWLRASRGRTWHRRVTIAQREQPPAQAATGRLALRTWTPEEHAAATPARRRTRWCATSSRAAHESGRSRGAGHAGWPRDSASRHDRASQKRPVGRRCRSVPRRPAGAASTTLRRTRRSLADPETTDPDLFVIAWDRGDEIASGVSESIGLPTTQPSTTTAASSRPSSSVRPSALRRELGAAIVARSLVRRPQRRHGRGNARRRSGNPNGTLGLYERAASWSTRAGTGGAPRVRKVHDGHRLDARSAVPHLGRDLQRGRRGGRAP